MSGWLGWLGVMARSHSAMLVLSWVGLEAKKPGFDPGSLLTGPVPAVKIPRLPSPVFLLCEIG